MKHVHKAHTEGFYDNMGKYTNMKPFFEVLLDKNIVFSFASLRHHVMLKNFTKFIYYKFNLH